MNKGEQSNQRVFFSQADGRRELIFAWTECFCMFPRLMDYDVFKVMSSKPKIQVKSAIFFS